MGQIVTCACGQRNNLDSYGYGEPRQCVACGKPLPHPSVELPGFQPAPAADTFEPSVTGFEAREEEEGGGAPITGFETPTSVADPPPAPPAARSWEGGVRESSPAPADDQACCVQCRRPFRGDWDKHARWDGTVCHICSTQADPSYRPPDQQTKRELYRPAPPKKLAPKTPEDDSELREAKQKKKRELTLLCTVAVVVLVIVNVFPVETWMAMFFASDLSQAEDLASSWRWVIYGTTFIIGAFGHMVTLYIALSMSKLLHPGGMEQNAGPLIYLGFAFQVLNSILMILAALFLALPFGIVLIGIAFVIMITIKYLMVSERFHIGFEGFVGFFLAWIVASIVTKPCMFALNKLVQGIIAAIAL